METTTNSDEHLGCTDTSSMVAYQICLCIFIAVGVPANLSIIYLILTVKQLRNLSNAILCLVCIADLATLLTMVPWQLFPIIQIVQLWNPIITIQIFVCALSIFSLTMLSYDRHIAVIKPLDAHQTLKSNSIKITLIVILSFFAAFPFFFYVRFDDDHELIDGHLYYIIPVTFLLLYVLPLFTISVLYVRMARKLTYNKSSVQESIKSNKKVGKQRNRVAMIVLSLVIIFAICWLPFFLDLLIFLFSDDGSCTPFQVFVHDWKTLFLLANPMLDPLSIYILGSRYRWYISQTCCFRRLCGIFCQESKNNPLESSTASQMKSMPTRTSAYFKPLYNTTERE